MVLPDLPGLEPNLYVQAPPVDASADEDLRWILADYVARYETHYGIRYSRQRLPFGNRWIGPEDVWQDTLLALLEFGQNSGNKPNLGNGIRPLMKGIAAHKAADANRILYKLGEREPTMFTLPENIAYGANTERQVLDSFGQEEARRLVQTLLTRVSEGRRQLLETMMQNPELPGKELAEKLGTTPEAFRVRKFRTMQVSREIINTLVQALDDDAAGGENSQGRTTPQAGSRQPLALRSIQARVQKGLEALHEVGEHSAAAHIPHYIGQWAVAANVVRAALISGHSEATALIIYPYSNLLPRFKQYIAAISRLAVGSLEESADRRDNHFIAIATSRQVRASHQRFDYVVGTDKTPRSVYDHLRPNASFLLRLVAREPEQVFNNFYAAPSFQGTKRHLSWEPAASIHLTREYWLANGHQITQEEIERLAATKEGPSFRQLCRGFADLADLRRQARYSVRPSPGHQSS